MSTVTIVGLGNIGAAFVMFAARMFGVRRMTLIDPDDYTRSNVMTQIVDTSAVGRPKVEVQAAAIHAINPQIVVDAIQARVENVPLARLDNSVLVSCVDSRNARQTINRAAWRCNKPWIDGAVGAPSVARVNVYVPDESAACLECRFDNKNYELLEQEYACDAGNMQVPATGAPADLGAIVASFQAAELRKLLDDDAAAHGSLVGAQFMLDTSSYAAHHGRFKRNRECRFDHESWQIEASGLTPQDTLTDLFAAVGGESDPAISLEGHSFVTCVSCVACGRQSSVGLKLSGRLSESERVCDCGGRMFAPGFFSAESIRNSELATPHLCLKLTDLGFCFGDVITVTDESGKARHIEFSMRAI
jgi:molybdopterin/thiamine biosynthesis adenylyltransferase